MSLHKIRAANRVHTFTDEAVGRLAFNEPTTRAALAWMYQLRSAGNESESGKLTGELAVMIEAFISLYQPDDGEEPATEVDAEQAYKLTGGWMTGTLADFMVDLIRGGIGAPEQDSEAEAAEDFSVSSTA